MKEQETTNESADFSKSVTATLGKSNEKRAVLWLIFVIALIVLLAAGCIPVLKLACMSVLYKLAAAVAEPVADKRIVGCIKSMAQGGVLYLKLVCYGIVLFFATIALQTAAVTSHA